MSDMLEIFHILGHWQFFFQTGTFGVRKTQETRLGTCHDVLWDIEKLTTKFRRIISDDHSRYSEWPATWAHRRTVMKRRWRRRIRDNSGQRETDFAIFRRIWVRKRQKRFPKTWLMTPISIYLILRPLVPGNLDQNQLLTITNCHQKLFLPLCINFPFAVICEFANFTTWYQDQRYTKVIKSFLHRYNH